MAESMFLLEQGKVDGGIEAFIGAVMLIVTKRT